MGGTWVTAIIRCCHFTGVCVNTSCRQTWYLFSLDFFFSVEVRNFGEKSQVRPPLTSDLCVEACVVIITIVM